MTMRHRKSYITLGVVLALLVIAVAGRLYLPYWLKDYVNEQIAGLEEYGGGVEDIDIYLWRGAYQIYGLNIHKNEGGLEKPFVASEKIDLSVEWDALLNGAIVAEIDIYKADLNFSKTQTGKGAGWADLVDKLSPFDINRLTLHGGKLSYIDYTAEPNVNLFIKDIEAKVTNLRNVTEENSPLPSQFNISGNSIGKGKLKIDGRMNVFKKTPDFDMDLELRDANLSAFNDYARAYAALDFERGTIGIFGELAAADSNVTGYVKLVATNVSVASTEKNDNPFNALWQSVASVFVELFQNQPKDQFALRIPIEGKLDNPDQDLWSAFLSIFSNAFGQAFTKNEDGTINFMDAVKKEEANKN